MPPLKGTKFDNLRVKVHKSITEGLTLESRFQFERKGFFCLDKDSDVASGKIVFNETVGLVEIKK